MLAVTNATEKKYGLKSIGDLKKVGSFKLGGFPGVQDPQHLLCRLYEAVRPLEGQLRLPRHRFRHMSRSTRATCSRPTSSRPIPPLGKPSKYTVLADPKHVTGFQNVTPLVTTSVLKPAGPTFSKTVNAVSAKLTTPAIIAMNKAFYVDKEPAAKIAKAFLQANGLL